MLLSLREKASFPGPVLVTGRGGSVLKSRKRPFSAGNEVVEEKKLVFSNLKLSVQAVSVFCPFAPKALVSVAEILLKVSRGRRV